MPRRKKGTGQESCKSGGSINKGKPQQRNAANARERARMRVLSKAFCRLKTTLPWVPSDTKLSKLDTLRLAGSYIKHLKDILDSDNFPPSDDNPALTLTWPFGFNRPTNLFEGSGSAGGGSDVEEESNEGGCWDHPQSPSKDCIHLESQPDLLLRHHNKHNIQMQLQQESKYKCHTPSSSTEDPSCLNNNNNLMYNYNQHHHQQHIPSYYQNDVILSIS